VFDLRAYLRERVSRRDEHGDEWQLPHCSTSGKLPLWVNVEKGLGFCFRCRQSYSVLDLVQLIEGCNFLQAVAIVHRGETLDSELRSVMEALTVDDPPRLEKKKPAVALPREYKPVAHMRKRPPYLVSRKVSRVDCARHRIGVCFSGYYARRVIVPIVNLEGRLVSFVARWLGDPPKGVKKVLYPRGSKISTVLFNHRHARQWSNVVICEGVFDALRVGSHAVALNGKHASRSQLALLALLGQKRRLTLLLDPDASVDAEELAADLCSVCPAVRIGTVPRKDPGECSTVEIAQTLREARRCGVHCLTEATLGCV
jgi:hypothetical protein